MTNHATIGWLVGRQRVNRISLTDSIESRKAILILNAAGVETKLGGLIGFQCQQLLLLLVVVLFECALDSWS